MGAEASPPAPLLGEIRLFAGLFAPKGWAFCDGSLLKTRDYPALFRLLGTIYGGDGANNFAIPDLQSRVPIHEATGFRLGQTGGVERVTLSEVNLPKHIHNAGASRIGGSDSPSGNVWGATTNPVYADAPGDLTMSEFALSHYGNSEAHENRIPFLAMYYIIALQGSLPESESR